MRKAPSICREKIGKILIKAPNYAGDVMMSLPALKAIRSIFPAGKGHEIHVLVEGAYADLVPEKECCDRILRPDWDYHKVTARAVSDYLRREGPYDMGVLLTRQLRFARGFRKAGIRFVFGCTEFPRPFERLLGWMPGRPLGWLLRPQTHKVTTPGGAAPSLRGDQVAHYFSFAKALAEAVGVQNLPAIQDPSLSVLDQWRQDVVEVLLEAGSEDDLEFYAVAAGSGASIYGERKRWPLMNFISLVRRLQWEQSEGRLRNGRDLVPVFLFGPSDRALHDRLVSEFHTELPGRSVVVKPGSLGWGQVLAILERCRFVVTGDTGPRHAAAAIRKQTVSIFGPTDLNHAVYAADLECPVQVDVGCNQGGECKVGRCTQKHICMTAVTPGLVADSILRHVYKIYKPEGGTS